MLKFLYNFIFFFLFFVFASCTPETLLITKSVCDVATEICFYSSQICSNLPKTMNAKDSLTIFTALNHASLELQKYLPDSTKQKFKNFANEKHK